MSIYFAHSGRYTKIGFSKDPISRASTITTSGMRPHDLQRNAQVTLLGWVPGDRWREGQIHAQFIDQRIAGEWFVIDEQIIRDLIWSDPCGVDIQRMSALAVLTADRNKGVSRDELAEAGIPIEAKPLGAALDRLGALLMGQPA